MLEVGQYPRNPEESGYVELNVLVKRGKKDAYFITPVVLHADINYRLKRAYQDGLMLRMKYCDGYDEGTIAEHFRISYQETIDRIHSALVFVSGWYTKRMDYIDWKKKRTYRSRVYLQSSQKRKNYSRGRG